MSKMKKALLMCAAYVLVAALAIGGTVAYLQDDDNDTNVMTLGNVKIEQHEYERATNADGSYKTATIDNQTSYVLQDFTQAKPLLPSAINSAEGSTEWDWDLNTTVRMSQVGSHGGMSVFKAASNAQDKFVVVENTGKTDAYVRTLVAIEIGSTDGSLIGTAYHLTWESTDFDPSTPDVDDPLYVEINGHNYMVIEYIYEGGYSLGGVHDGFLPAGETAYPSLSQVYIHSKATNEDMEKLDGNGNGTLDILVVSQAVQAAGFENAQTALDTAFGKAADKAVEWFGGERAPVIVNSAAELQTALDEATAGNNTIVIAENITGNVTVTQKAGVKITIDGTQKTFNGVMTVFGNGRKTTAGLTIKNIDFVAANGASSCIVSPDRKVNNAYSYSSNVTVEGCTFTDPDGVVNCAAVRHEDGGDSNWKIIDCVVDSTMHSMVQVNNVELDGLLIQGCEIYSKNGINLNQCAKVSIVDCNIDVKGYTVRYGVNGATVNGTFEIKDSTLKSANDDGDAVIICRGNMAGSTLTITNTTLTGTPEITGNANVVR